jgi:hypothetical protein
MGMVYIMCLKRYQGEHTILTFIFTLVIYIVEIPKHFES